MSVQADVESVLLVTEILEAARSKDRPGVVQETWVSIAVAIWISMAINMFCMNRAQKAGAKSAQALTGVMHLLLLVALYAMIFQPGAPG